MGAGNVKAAYALWADLPGKPFQVLVFMALTAGDRDDPPRSWMKREKLVVGLGRIVPDEDLDDPEVTAQRKAAFKALAEHVSVLTHAGAITLLRKPQRDRTAEYRLNLTPELKAESLGGADSTTKTGVQPNRKTVYQPPAAEPGNRVPADRETVSSATRKSGRQVHENRGPEEYKQDLHEDLDPDDTSARSATTVTGRTRCPACGGRVSSDGEDCLDSARCGWSEATG